MTFRDLTLRRKLIVIGIAASACALLLTSIVFLTTTYLLVRRSVQADVVAQANIVAENSTAALAFNDQDAAAETLHALRAKANVDIACLYDASGELFTYFSAAETGTCPATAPGDGERTTPNSVAIAQPVALASRRLGTVYLRGNLDEVTVRMRVQAAATAFGFVIGMVAAALIASRLERIILSPLRSLSETAARISGGNDYALRAPKQTGGEIGALVDAFNGMVDQVERRDHRLSAANEELSRASRLKDEFLAALSHELRTPLNAILGWLQILLKTPVGPEQARRALDSVERNARAQARLIEDLLDVSRIISGKFHFKSEIVEAVGVVQTAIDSIRPAAAARRVELVIRLADPPRVVMGDPDRLRQAIWNVLSNAVKFSATGGQLEIGLSESAGQIAIVVRDFGIGIDPAFLPHVFDRFRQADGSLTRQHGGLGLGLAIAQEIVELHGGTVRAESDGLGTGATFSIALPVLATMREDGLRTDAAAPPVISLDGMTILVVDDDADACELARMALTAAGAEVVVAAGALQALATFERRPFDAIVCDVAMPLHDGYEVLQQIRQRESQSGRFTPAIAVTAYAAEDNRHAAETAGFQSFLSKPYEFQDLIGAVARLRAESRSAWPNATA